MVRDAVSDAFEPERVCDKPAVTARFDPDWEKGVRGEIGAELREKACLVIGPQNKEQARLFANELVARQRPANSRIVLVAKARQFNEFFF